MEVQFAEAIRDVAKRSKTALTTALTEEATKTAVILPLIRAFGFDVFNLDEVVPEFISDVGTKKGEKVDYALKIDGKIVALIEVKPITSSLGNTQFNQLFRYFHVTDARLGVLTNGRDIWFFSDIDEPNKMDKKPFLKFDLHSFDDRQVAQLKNFHKSLFDMESIIDTANSLRYASAAATYIQSQLEKPDEEFIRFIGRNIYAGSLTKGVVDQLRPSIQAALDIVVKERIQDKLSVAFHPPPEEPVVTAAVVSEEGVETTDEELHAFRIIQAIAAEAVDVERIVMRDAKSYCAILMDDNNRRPICRLYFNSKSVKRIGIFDSTKAEERVDIDKVSDIYRHKAKIVDVARAYLER